MSMTRKLIYMLLGVIALPFLLLRFGLGMFRGIGQDPFRDMDQAKADNHVRLVASKPVAPTGDEIHARAKSLALAEDWTALSALLNEAVASARMTK
ncbi:MAG: hypothetical protein AAFN59_07140, partial [Pseudomonadota bacterium]